LSFSAIKTAAINYHSDGLNVISISGKEPLTPWMQWQTIRQTRDDFENLPWNIADGFALIGGSQTKNQYLCAIDVDVKNLSKEVIEKGKAVLTMLPSTKIEETPSGGQHWIYWSKKKTKIISTYLQVCGLELLGENKLIIMSPSKGYRENNDAEITVVEDLEFLFFEALQKCGLVLPKNSNQWFGAGKPKKFYNGSNPPCINGLMQNGSKMGERNNTAIRLWSYLLNFKGMQEDEAWKIISEWNNHNSPPLTEAELNSSFASAAKHGYVYGCQDGILQQYCSEECTLNKSIHSSNHKELPFVALSDGRLVEEGYDGKEAYFLVYNSADKGIEKTSQIESDGIIYKPLNNDEVEFNLTLFPSEAEDYSNDKVLLQEIMDFMSRWHEAPTERDRKIDALYVLLTYISDILPRSPYRRMLGALGRGKSAWIETIGSICYRPIRLAGCDTDKAICRRLNIWRGTALIDEADFGKSDLYAFITKILNMGYDRKTGYYQRSDDKDPKKVVTYNIYGPKIIASREPFSDMALESRCIKTIARENSKSMPLFRMNKFASEAQKLRNKLLLWRFHHYHKVKDDANNLESSQFEAELGLKGVSSRIKEILSPLSLVSDDFRSIIPSLAKELDEEIKNDKEYQLEIEFNQAITEIVEENERLSCSSDGSDATTGSPKITSTGIDAYFNTSDQPQQKNEEKVAFYEIPLAKIGRKILNNPKIEQKELNGLCSRLSRMLKTRLGFKVVSGTGGRRYVEVSEAYIKTVTTSTTSTKQQSRVVRL
jgi:hypothetical protein